MADTKVSNSITLILMSSCLVAMVTMVHADAPRFCPVDHTHNDAVSFYDREEGFFPSNLAFVCNGGTSKLHCCMKGAHHIEWFKYDHDLKEWKNLLWYTQIPDIHFDDYYLMEENQTAVLEHISGGREHTLYNCTGYGLDGSVVINTVQLNVTDCTSWNKAPIPMAPPHQTEQLERLPRQNLTMECSGFFGPMPSLLDYIVWLYINNSSEKPVPGTFLDNSTIPGRVYVTIHKDIGTNTIKTFLVITSVEEVDYRTYQCLMYNGHQHGTVRTFELQYGDPDKEEVMDPATLVAVITISCIVALALVLFGFLWPWRYSIRLWYKTHVSVRRTTEDKRYHILLVYNSDRAGDDRRFAVDTLLPVLTDKFGYAVFVPDDITPNKPEFATLGNVANESSCIVMVISENFLDDIACRLCLQEQLGQTPIIFIIYRDMSWLNTGNMDVEDPNLDMDTFKAALRVVKKVKWPGDNVPESGPRLLKYRHNVSSFWDQLQLRVVNYTGVVSIGQSTNSLAYASNREINQDGDRDIQRNGRVAGADRGNSATSGAPLLDHQDDTPEDEVTLLQPNNIPDARDREARPGSLTPLLPQSNGIAEHESNNTSERLANPVSVCEADVHVPASHDVARDVGGVTVMIPDRSTNATGWKTSSQNSQDSGICSPTITTSSLGNGSLGNG